MLYKCFVFSGYLYIAVIRIIQSMSIQKLWYFTSVEARNRICICIWFTASFKPDKILLKLTEQFLVEFGRYLFFKKNPHLKLEIEQWI